MRCDCVTSDRSMAKIRGELGALIRVAYFNMARRLELRTSSEPQSNFLSTSLSRSLSRFVIEFVNRGS